VAALERTPSDGFKSSLSWCSRKTRVLTTASVRQ
jgi:hypothetical protein